MNTKTSSVYIANINWGVDQAKLTAFLAEQNLGIRDVKLIVDHDTGQSRGFAFAKIDDPEVLGHAIATLNGLSLEGRPLVVREALPKPDARPSVAPPRDYSQDERRHQGGPRRDKVKSWSRHDSDYRPGRH